MKIKTGSRRGHEFYKLVLHEIWSPCILTAVMIMARCNQTKLELWEGCGTLGSDLFLGRLSCLEGKENFSGNISMLPLNMLG